MKICHSSNCVFECLQTGEETTDLRVAIEWHKLLRLSVCCIYDGEEIGYIVYAGRCDKAENLPDDADYGVCFYCVEDKAFYINVPD